MNRAREELERTSALLRARGHGGPNSLGPTSAVVPARALSDSSVGDAETNRLLGDIVGRIDFGLGYEREVLLAVLTTLSESEKPSVS